SNSSTSSSSRESLTRNSLSSPSRNSPSPGRETIPSIGHEYADRASACVPAPDASQGEALAGDAAPHADGICRAARAFVVLVPRRCVAARRARCARRGARLRRARAHRPRRALRLARVRARGETLRRSCDHGFGADARRPLARDAARRDAGRLREPLPPHHRGARTHTATRARVATAGRAGARPGAPRGPERRPDLPLRLLAPRTGTAQPDRSGPARARVRTRPLLHRAAAPVRTRRPPSPEAPP